jgi:hypothetical protein
VEQWPSAAGGKFSEEKLCNIGQIDKAIEAVSGGMLREIGRSFGLNSFQERRDAKRSQ